jgi:uncharacterized membrane protein YfcA
MPDFLLTQQSGGDILILAAIALVAGLARGFSGFGAALIFMPLASTVINPAMAAPLLLIVDMVMSVGMIGPAWRIADKRDVATMSVGALFGVPLGTLTLALADPLALRWTIVALVVLLLITLISGWRYHGRPRALLTIAVGMVSGLFSGAAQVGGPPVVAYWLGGGQAGAIVRANIVLYFVVSSLLSLLSYLLGGLMSLEIVILGVFTGPAYGVGLYLGARLFSRAKEATFRRICYGLIAGAALIGLPLLDPLLR